MEPLRILAIYPETISDGYGLRYAIYFAGCAHRCPGCHNPQSHDPLGGEPLTAEWTERICDAIVANPILDGVTVSGGDPLLHPAAMAAFLHRVRERTGQNVWCYTGYTLEECLADPARGSACAGSTRWWTAATSRRCATCRSISGAAATSGSSTSRRCICSADFRFR